MKKAIFSALMRYIRTEAAEPPQTGPAVGRTPIRIGLWTCAAFFGGLGVWALLAPLNSAAIAPGVIVVDSSRKTIQHLEGGIIQTLYVKDGDAVRAGAPLIRLRETAVRANLNVVTKQAVATLAAEARLLAERDQRKEIPFDPWLRKMKAKSPEVAEILHREYELWKTRKQNVQGQADVLQEKIHQIQDRITGLTAQSQSVYAQIQIIQKELTATLSLQAKGFTTISEVHDLEKQLAALQGQHGELAAQVAAARQNISETQLEILNLGTRFHTEVIKELEETQNKLAEVRERKFTAEDALSRSVITAPVSGVVTDLQFHTVGGVIPPGSKIMDIVPEKDQLIIEARVQPRDIDLVHAGLSAKVRLSAFKTKKVPLLEGKVISVSPDHFVDPTHGISYFKAKISIETFSENPQLKHIQLHPGMPADVYIVTGSRTLFRYLMSPITDTFRNALRDD